MRSISPATPPARSPASGPSPEALLVLASAGGAAADSLIMSLVPRVQDWAQVSAVARAQGAQPVLSQRLRALGVPVPGGARRELGILERFAELRAAYLRRRLDEALACLVGAGMRVMLLKGAALAYATYRSFAARPMADVDLLVHPGDAMRAVEVLAGDGWIRRFDRLFDTLYADMHHLPPLSDARMPAMGVQLELHTGLFPATTSAFAFTGADLWAHAESVEGLPEGVVVPSREHRMLHCCLHYAWSHGLASGAWRALRDVEVMWNESRIDWDAFVAEAARSGGGTCAYWTLRLARRLAGTPIPDALLRRLGAPWPEPLNRVLERHWVLVGATNGAACPSTKLERFMWLASIRPEASGLGAARPWHSNDKPWEDALRSHGRSPGVPADERGAPPSAGWLGYLRGALA